MSFKDDLEKGMRYEEVVLSVLNEESNMNMIKNPDKKGMDLLIVENGIEVKKDFGAIKTGNAYIEYECNGIPSGIFKKESINLKYWVHSLSPNDFLLIDGGTFKTFVAARIEDCEKNKSNTSKGFRIVTGGDGNRSKGLLVPIIEMNKLAIQSYNT